MTLKGTPKEFAAPVPELQERQDVEDEIAANKATYLAWKEDLKRTGKTPSDAVAWCKARGFTEYADRLEQFIDQMEGSERAANAVPFHRTPALAAPGTAAAADP